MCLRVSLAVKSYHGHCNSHKGKHLIEVAVYSIRGSIHYHPGREGCSMQADIVLEEELLHIDMPETGSRLAHGVVY